ncbi:hypothetical protein AB4Y45_32840 [Paraburkholderia sp. EG287A]|uniref:hypothetical protein n=1 Tax=Paraburkholderia sp. EG287A TaxID=3237012 RepID=UPI0034D152D8
MQLATQAETKAASNTIEAPVPCPQCGALPETTKVRGHWRSRCTSVHARPILAASKRTKREAIRAWNDAYREVSDEVMAA